MFLETERYSDSVSLGYFVMKHPNVCAIHIHVLHSSVLRVPVIIPRLACTVIVPMLEKPQYLAPDTIDKNIITNI